METQGNFSLIIRLYRYANDTATLTRGGISETVSERLQGALLNIKDCCSRFELSFNSSKMNSILLTKINHQNADFSHFRRLGPDFLVM